MANTVTTAVVLDGPKHVFVRCYLKADGASGELTNQVLADPATLAPPAPGQTVTGKLSIVEVWYENVGFDVILKFNATTPVPMWKLAGASSSNNICLEKFGGLTDPQAPGWDGKVVFDTAGFNTANREGTFIVKLRKD
jgi:hypothetical protein